MNSMKDDVVNEDKKRALATAKTVEMNRNSTHETRPDDLNDRGFVVYCPATAGDADSNLVGVVIFRLF